MIPALPSDPLTLDSPPPSATPRDCHSRAGGNPEALQISPHEPDLRLRERPFSLSYTSQLDDQAGRRMGPQLRTLDSRLRGNDGAAQPMKTGDQ